MTYIAGDAYFCCDRCGLNRRRSMRAHEWTGLVVCRDTCLDPRPAELDPPNIYPEGVPFSDARPEGEDNVLSDNEVTRESL